MRVVRITADRPGAVTFSANLHGVRNPAHSNYGTDYFRMDGSPPADLRVTGKSSDYLGIEGRLRYEGRLRARVAGGTHEIDYRTLRVEKADEAVLIFAAATSFVNYRDVSADPAARVEATLSGVKDHTWETMREAHEREHRAWFDRVSLDLGASPAPDLPMDERIARFAEHPDPGLAALYYQFGLYLLIASSRVLVWGAVEIAQGLGVSDLIIGLTVVAVGTSLPELASAVIASRKGEHDIALGNVLGSNLFNTLAVVGIAVAIQPTAVPPEVLSRDMLVMGVLTLALFAIGYGFRGPGRINRLEGAALLTVYLAYTATLVSAVLGQ